jgi:hypothetical protein
VTEGEANQVVGEVAYSHTPFGLGTSRLGGQFDKGIWVATSARNWITMLKRRGLDWKAAG